jgi:hypothetical protein
VIHAVLCDGEGVTDEDARAAMRRVGENFVDWNEVRVARVTELARRLDPLPDADARARRLSRMLNALFEMRGGLVFDFLRDMKPTEGRKTVAEMDAELPRDTVSLLLFSTCPGTTIPLSNEALALARKEGLVSRTGNKQHLQKRLLADLEQEEAGVFVQCLEILAATGGKKRSTKKTAKKTTKKTAKKSTPAKKSGSKKSASGASKKTASKKTASGTSRKKTAKKSD